MDAFLLIATIVVAIVLLFVNIYILAIYIHPDDKGFGTSILAKILVVLGLTLSWGIVFMVPLDVSNSRGDGGGLDMDLFWKIVLIADMIMLVVLIPFGIFRYEGDEDASFIKRTTSALCYTVATIIFFGLVIGISYAFLSEASIPVEVYSVEASSLVSSSSSVTFASLNSVGNSDKLDIDVSFPVYIMAFFSLVGWIFFLFFGGLGLFAIPMDLINDYRYKPKKKTQRELATAKQDLQTKAGELLELGQNIKGSQSKVGDTDGFFAKRRAESKLNKDRNKFKAAVMIFEKEFEIYTLEKNYHQTNPLVYLLKLLAGILLFLVSLIWWIHVLIYGVIYIDGFPAHSFLNRLLIWFQDDANAGFIATAIFAFLSIYLIWAVTKGNVKFGIRVPFLFTLHPMKANETLMNSFLFNVWLILISSIACVQFLTEVFSEYVRLSTVDLLFGTQVRYMKFYEWFYKNRIFCYAFVIWSAIGLFLVCCFGRNRSQELKKIEQLKREVAKNKK